MFMALVRKILQKEKKPLNSIYVVISNIGIHYKLSNNARKLIQRNFR